MSDQSLGRKPAWLKVRVPGGEGYRAVRRQITGRGLHTVCDEARCPNREECFRQRTATVMVLGRICTRGCRFCSVVCAAQGAPVDPAEPAALAQAVVELGLRYVVLTMVTRDDLPDGGAAHLARCVAAVHLAAPGVGIELLGSDFGGDPAALAVVAHLGATVVAHNLETVRRLTPLIRHPRSSYARSLTVLRELARLLPDEVPTKSSLMVGLGETDEEVQEALEDLRHHGVRLVTIGQYLQPTPRSWPVAEYLPPARFARFAAFGRRLGFDEVLAGPLVRSSFGAAELARAVAAEGLPAGTDRGSER